MVAESIGNGPRSVTPTVVPLEAKSTSGTTGSESPRSCYYPIVVLMTVYYVFRGEEEIRRLGNF